ncbi:hypothetical protein [Bosea beijingensis]|uniref:hypothetical protein n=1 Tax=Bosea beijingensis TaxID=3068632 RepID=UPI002740BB49|nr:hypothetical protein [Bosea sp. REN20]
MRILSGIAVAAALLQFAPVFAQAPGKAPPAVQKEFDDFIAKFRAALKANDAATVATMTRLPFMADDSVRDAAQFRAKAYPRDFTAKNRACLQRTKPVYAVDGNKNDVYSVICGESIFTFTRTPAGFLFTDLDTND